MCGASATEASSSRSFPSRLASRSEVAQPQHERHGSGRSGCEHPWCCAQPRRGQPHAPNSTAWAALRVAWAVRLCFSLVRRAALVYRRAAASRSVVIVLALAAALEVAALGCCAGGLPTIAVGAADDTHAGCSVGEKPKAKPR